MNRRNWFFGRAPCQAVDIRPRTRSNKFLIRNVFFLKIHNAINNSPDVWPNNEGTEVARDGEVEVVEAIPPVLIHAFVYALAPHVGA